MTPEEKARQKIDKKLEAAGWTVQDKKDIDLYASLGVAVREFTTADNHEVDYALFIDGDPVGLVEAKEDNQGVNLTNNALEQNMGYVQVGLKNHEEEKDRLRFIYEATSIKTLFVDLKDPQPRTREIFSFHCPETLKLWIEEYEREQTTLRGRLLHFPELPTNGFRECQINAIVNLEKSFGKNHPRALVQMATGAGKTFTAITACYRLLKSAKAKRILFLVDTKQLGEQAETEYKNYQPYDSQDKLASLYNITRIQTSNISQDTQICISTIQRLYSAQFTWEIPQETDIPYFRNKGVRGQLLATEKPLKPGLRGITLYAHGRMVNAPEFFGVGESSHFYSYLTGWLDLDFVDEQDEDIISTDRQSLSWDLPITSELQEKLKQLLSSVERDWREKRKVTRERKIKEQTRIDIGTWYPTLSPQIKEGVEKIVNSVVENSEMEGEKQSEVVGMLHSLIPEYAQYHWRHLHKIVQDASYNDYKNEDFYRAVDETIKRYESLTQKKSGQSGLTGQGLITQVFGKDKTLSVSEKYKKRDCSNFTTSTTENIEEGQKFFSMGVFAGVRNPIAHAEIIELKETGLFTENDCLDMLSLLSHLFRRLDDAVKK